MKLLPRGLSLLLAAAQAAPVWAQGASSRAAVAARGAGLALPASAVTAARDLRGPSASAPAATPTAAAAPRAAAPDVPVSAYGRMTGALGRDQEDPGPVKRMWLVYGTDEELAVVQEALAKVKDANPGVEVFAYRGDLLIPREPGKDGGFDARPEAKHALFDRLLREGAEFVLATNQDIYEHFRSLRDSNLARQIPMGFAGRKFVSVDMPRESLDPAKLSDPGRYPARRYLWLGDERGAPARAIAGIEGVRRSLEGALASGEAAAGGEGVSPLSIGMRVLLRLSGQADSRAQARLRRKAHKLADYLEKEKVDLVVTQDPEATRVLGLMKRMGYHKSLPVIWADREAPADASAVSVALAPAGWQADAPHVAVAPQPALPQALAFAQGVERVPENFMEMGGVTARGFVPAVSEAVERALPRAEAADGRFDVHFLLTNGNGVAQKGDANPFGHFGMAVTDERGKAQVWTVQYNDGGSFTGGLGDGKQLTLAEYLYSLWYLPGAVGQAIPLAETAVAPVFDFILRGLDEAQVEEMRRKAAEINARHLRGLDNYQFLNKGGMTNCISLVTQILRAAGFRIPETGVQDPAGQAYNMAKEFARWLLSGRLGAGDFGLVVFDRPAHSGPAHYRIPNTALASPLFNREKPWRKMTWRDKLTRFLAFPLNLARASRVPRFIEEFAALASHRVVVGPGSRDPLILENADSPVLKLRAATEAVGGLRRARVPLMEELGAVEDRILKAIGLEGWQANPAQTLAERARDADPETRARLEADLAEHHRLTVALALNRIDEQVELRRVDFLKIRLADPAGRYARRIGPLQAAHKRVIAYRDRVLLEDRVLTEAEIEELDRLNARIERDLESARQDLLKDAGPAVPQSIRMILGQVDRDTLEELRDLSGGGADGKGKEAK